MARETEYWLKLLRGRKFYLEEIDELLKMNTKLNILLRKSISTAKKSIVTKDKTIRELKKYKAKVELKFLKQLYLFLYHER